MKIYKRTCKMGHLNFYQEEEYGAQHGHPRCPCCSLVAAAIRQRLNYTIESESHAEAMRLVAYEREAAGSILGDATECSVAEVMPARCKYAHAGDRAWSSLFAAEALKHAALLQRGYMTPEFGRSDLWVGIGWVYDYTLAERSDTQSIRKLSAAADQESDRYRKAALYVRIERIRHARREAATRRYELVRNVTRIMKGEEI